MRKLLILLLTTAGCRMCPAGPVNVEQHVAAVASARSVPGPPENIVTPCGAAVPFLAPPGPLDLPTLWDLTVVHNPSLREAAADVEAVRGRLIQAGLYPNPRFLYDENTIGSRIAPQGNITLQVNQEILTAGKRRLDQAVASRETDAASLALLGRKFEILTRVRRAYYGYLGWAVAVRASEEVVAVLEQGLKITRRLVEEVQNRPRTDLLRTEALLEEAQISLARNRANRDGAWRQLAAEVGVTQLPPPEHRHEDLPASVPHWVINGVEHRVLAANTALKEAGVEVERARLATARAKAQVVPNVMVGAGYTAENIDQTAGGVVTLEVPLPLWDRNQGNIHASQAQLARVLATVKSTANRLSRETAAAFASYEAARQQAERLTARVLPRLQESLQQLQRGYQAGAPQVTFADVLQAEQALLTARLTLADARRTLWLAIADLQGLMQLDLGEELCPERMKDP